MKNVQADMPHRAAEWETIRSTRGGDPEVKRLSLTPNVTLVMDHVAAWNEYPLDITVRMEKSDVTRRLTLVPAEGPDTWEYMQEIAEAAARLWLSELAGLASAAAEP